LSNNDPLDAQRIGYIAVRMFLNNNFQLSHSSSPYFFIIISQVPQYLLQIFSEAKGAEDRGSDSKDQEGENLRPEDGDSVSF
jgi:hypothetical protein